MSALRLIPFPSDECSYSTVENACFTGYRDSGCCFPAVRWLSGGLTRFVEAVDEIKRLSVGREPARMFARE